MYVCMYMYTYIHTHNIRCMSWLRGMRRLAGRYFRWGELIRVHAHDIYMYAYIHTYIHTYIRFMSLWRGMKRAKSRGRAMYTLGKVCILMCLTKKLPFSNFFFCAELWPGNKSCCARTKSWRCVWLRMFVFVYMATYLSIQISMLLPIWA